MTAVQALYEPRIARARAMIASAPIVSKLLAPTITSDLLERFLIEYCSLGVQITEPVEGWIARSGERCIELGLSEIGTSLCNHAAHEADHHLMFIEDTQRLVGRWNARHPSHPSDAEALIARKPTRAMQHYIDLHETTIVSTTPFAQVAIELEIERLSVALLPDLLAQFRRVLGPEVLESLSFLGEHAALDVGHTHLNTRMMDAVLAQRPESAGDLARIGAEALFIYMAFFDECLSLAADTCAELSAHVPHAVSAAE
jgi:hypothetical protein